MNIKRMNIKNLPREQRKREKTCKNGKKEF